MNTKRTPIIFYLIIVAIYATSCASGPEIMGGDVLSLHKGTAEWIIDGCMRGECASYIYVKDQLIVYARPLVDNVAFIVTSKGIPTDKLTGLTGNLVNCETWRGFQDWLFANGFTIVSAGAPAYRLVLGVAQSIASMELIPIFSLNFMEPGELPEWIAGEQEDV